MKIWTAALALLLPIFRYENAAANTMGNGGDGVECLSSSANTLAGTFVLDFLVDYQHTEESSPFYTGPMLPQDRILTLLERKAPDLAASFRSFLTNAVAQIGHDPDFTSNEVWVPTDLTGVDTQDQELYETLPINCRADGVVKLKQAVVRTERVDGIIYKYDRAIFNLWLTDPLQLSFILVHEWLWSHVDSADYIREVNQLLHRANADDIPDSQFEGILARLGVSGLGPNTWIERTIVETIEQLRQTLSPFRECAFQTSSDPTVKAWWRTHGSEVMGRLSNWYSIGGNEDLGENCVQFGSTDVPFFWPEICASEITDGRSAKLTIASALIKHRGYSQTLASQMSQGLVDSTNPLLCRIAQ